MNLKKWNLKQKLAAAVLLLVLVISCAAYFIYVPKLQELESLQNDLQQAEHAHAQLQQVAPVIPLTTEAKQALAAQVPTTLDQSRFIDQLRDMEAKSGVVIQSLTFTEAATSERTTGANKTQTQSSGAPVLHALQEVDGNLSYEGTYSQVREFVSQMAALPRLVTYKTWSLSTKQVPIKSSTTANASGSSSSALPANLPPSQLSDDVLTDPLLKNRTPIDSEADFNQELAAIKSKNTQFKTQHALDMANLEIQQTFNRYVAGLLGQKQAETLLDQDYAGHYLPGANTNIRQVLGLDSLYAPSSSPLSLLLNSSALVQASTSSGPMQTIVTVNMQFAIYDAPTASDILPKPDAVQTYSPALRSDPVETK